MAGEGLLNATCSKENYDLLCKFLEQQCGIVLGENKQYLVRSRLSSMVAQYKCTNLDDLLRKTVTTNDRGLQAAVVDAMTNDTGAINDLWVFIVAPLVGAALAAVVYKFLESGNKEEKK